MGAPGPSETAYWREVEEVFSAAAGLSGEGRAALLAERCAGRSDLQAEVEALLVSHAEANGFIQARTSSQARTDQDPGSPASDELDGTRVGAFVLREKLAEGGMGAVFRAERVEGGFAQAAAVKLIASRLHSADLLRRFEAERQILASLQHPNVVGLLDGGVTPAGQPYIAMELVGGRPITDHCAERGLSERIRHFLQVCAAVGFAHRRLVVHRDLKPGNVFVTQDGLVKVLDFGIAKLLEAEGAGAEATVGSRGPLTTGYASPEQLRGAPVGTSSDVYSLGVMLYELLAGRRPYETAGKTLDAVLDLVLHADPPRPSTSPRGALPYDPGQLRGDLDAIVLKAMSKEPDRRYASAEALAEDLGRHLEKRPVLARPDGRAYVAGRFVRRHRAAVAALAVAVVAVLGGLGVALWQARVARAERDRATVQMRTAQQTTKLLSGIFENANPVVSRGRTVTARDLLDAGTSAIDRDLAGEPEAQAALLLVMARAYVRQDQTARALELAERALSLRESLPSRWQDLAESLHAVGQIRRRRGQLSEALPPLQRAARLYDAGSDDRLAVECLRDLALTLRGLGRNAEARVPLGRAIALEERAAPESARLGLLLNNLGNLRVAEGDLVAGRAALERSIHVYGKSAEAGTWSSTLPMLSLADLLRQQEEFEPARALFERALAVGDETFGRQSTSSAYTLGRLGELALAQGDLALARELLSESSRLYEATEPGAIGAYVTRGFMGRLLLAERKPAQALPLLQEVVAYRTRSNGPKHADLASALVDLALAQRAHHGPAAAQPTLARALEIQRAAFSSAHPALIRTLNALADMTEAQGDREAALGFADEAVRIASARLPARHSERLKAEARVARLRGR